MLFFPFRSPRVDLDGMYLPAGRFPFLREYGFGEFSTAPCFREEMIMQAFPALEALLQVNNGLLEHRLGYRAWSASSALVKKTEVWMLPTEGRLPTLSRHSQRVPQRSAHQLERSSTNVELPGCQQLHREAAPLLAIQVQCLISRAFRFKECYFFPSIRP